MRIELELAREQPGQILAFSGDDLVAEADQLFAHILRLQHTDELPLQPPANRVGCAAWQEYAQALLQANEFIFVQ